MPFSSKKFALIVGLVIFLAGVSLFAYLGYYNRTWADDWCYNADFRNLGFLETIRWLRLQRDLHTQPLFGHHLCGLALGLWNVGFTVDDAPDGHFLGGGAGVSFL